MKEKLKNKKVVYTIIGIISVLLVAVAITYAYWLVTQTQEGENVITTGCLDITLNGENDITLENQFPISDADGMKLTPYTFTVTNNCTTSVDYQIALETFDLDGKEEIAANSLKVALNDSVSILSTKKIVESTIYGAIASYKLATGTLVGKSDTSNENEATYELRIWIDENAPIEEMNKILKSKISVTVGQGITNPPFKEGTLAFNILDTAEASGYLYAESPIFTQNPVEGEFGLYVAEDDEGNSYYYRGYVQNNNFRLGETGEYYLKKHTITQDVLGIYHNLQDCEDAASQGDYYECVKQDSRSLYWKILRINGDGSIRLVYSGTEDSNDDMIETGTTADKYDEEFYGTYFGSGISYVNSNVASIVNSWYVDTLKDKYEDYLADSVFCNNTKITSATYYDANGKETTADNAVDKFLGYGPLLSKPELSCSDQEEDSLTVENERLNYPIGLITASELKMAGGTNSYLNGCVSSGTSCCWTMSPLESFPGADMIYTYDLSGLPASGAKCGVRPVINLKSDINYKGNGSIETPYEIVIN